VAVDVGVIANNLEALPRAIDAAGVQLVTKKGKPVGIEIANDPLDSEEGSAASADALR
jgi:hypothetical protein